MSEAWVMMTWRCANESCANIEQQWSTCHVCKVEDCERKNITRESLLCCKQEHSEYLCTITLKCKFYWTEKMKM